MNMFTGVTGTDASGDRKPWFEVGRYRVRISACRGVQSRKGDTFYIVEGELLIIRQTDVPEKMKVGRHYGQMIKFNDDMGPINAKRFVLCAMGFDPNLESNQALVGDDEVNYSVGNDQPFKGLEMELHCELITTKAGNPFTKHNWTPCDPEQWGANTPPSPAPPQPPPQPFQGVPALAIVASVPGGAPAQPQPQPVADPVGVALGVVPPPAQPVPQQPVPVAAQPVPQQPVPVAAQPVPPQQPVAQPPVAPQQQPAPDVPAPPGFPTRGGQQ